MDFITLKDVTKTYPTGVTAVSGLNLSIKKGDFAGKIGVYKAELPTFKIVKEYYWKVVKSFR